MPRRFSEAARWIAEGLPARHSVADAAIEALVAAACAKAGLPIEDYQLAYETPETGVSAYQMAMMLSCDPPPATAVVSAGARRAVDVPDDGRVYYHLGMVRWLRGEVVEALRSFAACLSEVDGGVLRAGALCYRGLCRAAVGDREGALADLRRAEELAATLGNEAARSFAAAQRAALGAAGQGREQS